MIMILIITNKSDITTDYVINKLNKSKIQYYRLNTEDLISTLGVHFDFHKKLNLIVDKGKDLVIDLQQIRSIYFRRPQIPSVQNYDASNGEKQFILREITYTLEGLYSILFERFWISPVFSIRKAENKIYQLILAKQLGFMIPKSISLFQSSAFFCSKNIRKRQILLYWV
jgi:MvdD pre-ATP grasp domain